MAFPLLRDLSIIRQESLSRWGLSCDQHREPIPQFALPHWLGLTALKMTLRYHTQGFLCFLHSSGPRYYIHIKYIRRKTLHFSCRHSNLVPYKLHAGVNTIELSVRLSDIPTCSPDNLCMLLQKKWTKYDSILPIYLVDDDWVINRDSVATGGGWCCLEGKRQKNEGALRIEASRREIIAYSKKYQFAQTSCWRNYLFTLSGLLLMSIRLSSSEQINERYVQLLIQLAIFSLYLCIAYLNHFIYLLFFHSRMGDNSYQRWRKYLYCF